MSTSNEQIIFISRKKDRYLFALKLSSTLILLATIVAILVLKDNRTDLTYLLKAFGLIFIVNFLISLFKILKPSYSDEVKVDNDGLFFKEQIYWDQVEKIGSIGILNYFAITLTTKNGYKILNFDIGEADKVSEALLKYFPESFQKREIIAEQLRLYKKRVKYL